MPKSNENDSRYIQPQTALPSCPDWCNVDHAGLAPDSGVDEGYHSRLLAEGVYTKSHGELYRAELEVSSSGGARLWVAVEAATMTADQAEVLGRALVEGARLLRARPDAVQAVRLTSYWRGGRLVESEPEVFEQTAAERALSSSAQRRS